MTTSGLRYFIVRNHFKYQSVRQEGHTRCPSPSFPSLMVQAEPAATVVTAATSACDEEGTLPFTLQLSQR